MTRKNIDKEIKQIITILESIGYKIQKTLLEEEVESIQVIGDNPEMNDFVEFQLIIRGVRFKEKLRDEEEE